MLTKREVIIITGGFLLLAVFNFHNIIAYFWTAENATVVMANCQIDCELTGTLSVIPFDGNYRLISEGREIYINKDSVEMVMYSVSAASHNEKQ